VLCVLFGFGCLGVVVVCLVVGVVGVFVGGLHGFVWLFWLATCWVAGLGGLCFVGKVGGV
jgi:hypothetical protein